MIKAKEDFLKNDFVSLLEKLNADQKPGWGTMSTQQMVEHLADSVKIASGKLTLPVLQEGEKLQKSREFLMSEAPLNENIANPFIPKEGIPHRQPDLQAAIKILKKELDHFFLVFDKDPELKTGNMFFGQLDYQMNIRFLYKHAIHHLRQFGLVPAAN